MTPKEIPKDRVKIKIPAILSVLTILEKGFVIFPHSTLSIIFQRRQIFSDGVGNFLIMASRTPTGRSSAVAVLGETKDVVEKEDRIRLNFFGLKRVNYQIVRMDESRQSARWYEFRDLPVAPELKKMPGLAKRTEQLRTNFAKFTTQIEKKIKGQDQGFFNLPVIADILMRVDGANINNFSQAIDGIMTVFNHPTVKQILGDLNYWTVMLMMLEENDPLERLGYVLKFLKDVTDYLSGKGELMSQNGAVHKVSNPEVVAQEGRKAIQAELAGLRATNPPPPPLKDFEGITSADSLLVLDPHQLSPFTETAINFFGQRMIDQEQTVTQYVRKLTSLKNGLADVRKPTVMGFLSGPTGVGKTLSVKVLAEFLMGNPTGFTRVDCNQLQESHAHAFLNSSPPGYVGYGASTPLSQWNIDKHHVIKRLREKYKENLSGFNKVLSEIAELEALFGQDDRNSPKAVKEGVEHQLQRLTEWRPGEHLAIILFDEVEKAHTNVFHVLYRMLDEGVLQSLSGGTTFFHNALIIFTSNIYGREIAKKISRRGELGFHLSGDQKAGEEFRQMLYRATLDAIQKLFPPEFVGRIK